ncbi:C-signal-like [Anomaloglossus baeobatrachus]|uniref:C-signal-like n=1 Tax=Anomaloglossus baeobatrachus TaxID=238106 RepID=UPI003F50A4ED
MTGGIALIQGASRGIGLQFCKFLVSARCGTKIIATCREPQSATDLQALREQHPDVLSIQRLDVTRQSDIQETALLVAQNFGCLDLLINSSAMLHPSGKGETSLGEVSAEGLSLAMATNTIGPLLMAKYFSPLLLKGRGAFGEQPSDKSKQHNAILVNMSAKVGSISDNGLGGWYSYRMSKSALNMATKCLSIELGRGKNKVVCVSLHPGTVETDLSSRYHKNVPKERLFSPERSVSYLMTIIDSLNMDRTGKFYAWNGSELPW